MLQDLIKKAHELVIDSPCDGVAVAVIDFNENTYQAFEVLSGDANVDNPQIYFDLASLTKPLTNSFIKIAEGIQDKQLESMLNHKAGIPAWGLLSKSDWKEQILGYPISESETVYSDFSALRFMLEVEKKTGKTYKELAFKNLDPEIKFWMDLDGSECCLQNGYYRGKQNVGIVHDPNAFNLCAFLSHAGLFGTITGVAKTLLNFNKEHKLIDRMQKLLSAEHSRFVEGFDTVTDPNNTLAGKGCSKLTFGHLGFTGTSFWIDAERGVGHVILTNSTKHHWFDKNGLNSFRREVGAMIWADNS